MPTPDVNTNAEDVTGPGRQRVLDAPYTVRGQATVRGTLIVRRSEAGGILSRSSGGVASQARAGGAEPTGRAEGGVELL